MPQATVVPTSFEHAEFWIMVFGERIHAQI